MHPDEYSNTYVKLKLGIHCIRISNSQLVTTSQHRAPTLSQISLEFLFEYMSKETIAFGAVKESDRQFYVQGEFTLCLKNS